MKKLFLMLAFCAVSFASCGNSALAEIKGAVNDAIEATQGAESAEDVQKIALDLTAQMEKISAEAGDKLVLSANEEIDELLKEYQDVVTAKITELAK